MISEEKRNFSIPNHTEKLQRIIRNTFKDDPDIAKLLKFSIEYKKDICVKEGCKYIPKTSTLVIYINKINEHNLLFAMIIHCAAHHIKSVKHKDDNHDELFRKIQERLLTIAFRYEYINPYKLAAYYLYLSDYPEATKLVKVCKNYIAFNKTRKFSFLQLNCPFNKQMNEYLKLNKFRYQEFSKSWYIFIDESRFSPLKKEVCDKLLEYKVKKYDFNVVNSIDDI